MDTSTKRILIVDDTPENIQVLGSVLRKYDYLINVAQNGQQALDAVVKVKPDLILLDVMMPVMDGFETCQRLKADPETADIPVIFLTASIQPEDIVKGLEIGGVDYVGKPFNAPELMQRVKTHLMIRDLQVNLEDRVNELDRAANTISRMARENEAFLRHELNNALSPVLGYADMLIRGVDKEAEKRTAWATKIKTSAEAMRELMEALRDLQALERGQHALNLEPTDVSAMVSDEVRNLEMASGVSIALESTATATTVSADSAFLPGVFRNLIKNAVEPVQSLPAADQGPSVSIKDGAGTLDIRVCNGGPPIPTERLERFFEKFNSTKVAQGGTGLGTSYSFVVVTAHGGNISVTSSAEDGTCILVQLPTG